MRATANAMKSSRRLRREMSPPEALLWRLLRRSHAIGPYVADFYCAAAKLVIEIDGQIHGFDDQASHDTRRDALINSYGVRVERVAASEVMRDASSIAQSIIEICLAGPLHHPALPDGPPPRDKLGED
ncbi:MAG: endonuclease domain-containing protein [Sphingomicrobium sp.]